MWDISNRALPQLLGLHVALSNLLCGETWTRNGIWNDSISVHQWQVNDDLEIAFDVSFIESFCSLTLIVRNPEWTKSVIEAFKHEHLPYKINKYNNNRFDIYTIKISESEINISELANKISQIIIRYRSALRMSIRKLKTWLDDTTGIAVPYLERAEKKNNSSIIFLFTSIRNKQHWVDFDGPNGASIRNIKSRIIFMLDEFSDEYSYHLLINKSSDVYTASLKFIINYVESNGYSWDRVMLAGLSKGATSALALGLKLPSCKLSLVAPQLLVGEYLLENRHSILQAMAGEASEEAAAFVNQTFLSKFESVEPNHGPKLIQIFTSENDPHCTEGITKLKGIINFDCDLKIYTNLGSQTNNHLETVHFHISSLLSNLSFNASISECKISNFRMIED